MEQIIYFCVIPTRWNFKTMPDFLNGVVQMSKNNVS